MKIEKILAGIDFGKDTERVLAYASFFADVFNASLDLLYVIDYLVTPPAYLTPYIEEEKKDAMKKFETLKGRLAEAGFKAGSEVIVGRLRESFGAAARKSGSTMLALGFMAHALRRSSSEKLIKGLKMPMLVVRGEKAAPADIGSVRIKKIFCPVDFSETSRNALKVAGELADRLSSKLNVLYVSPNYLIRKMRVQEDRDRAGKELRERAKDKFDDFLGGLNLKEGGIIEEGEPGREIVSFAKREDIDLIIMGARGIGFIQGMLIGSVTDAVLKSSPCPVLVIH